MLSLFPELLFLAPFAALIIRIALAVVLLIGAWRHIIQPSLWVRALAFVEAAAGIALVAGASTQLGALAALCCLVASLFYPKSAIFPRSTLILGCVMSLSLIVTGAGAFAIDLPL